jgi:phosphoserine phosphatase
MVQVQRRSIDPTPLPWLIVAALAVLVATAGSAWSQADPLPSWNDTAPKKAIIDVVSRVTKEGTADFIPAAERIAVFDMDGTLTVEQPIPAAVLPIIDEVKAAAAIDPSLKEKPAIAAFLKGDIAGIAAAGDQGVADIISVVTAGKTVEQVAAILDKDAAAAINPKLGKPVSKLAYQPMVELLRYLEANGFETWICSGSPVLFTRQVSQEMFGIPPERVMGSSIETRFVERQGKSVLVFEPKVDQINDKDGKPVTINLAIGRRPFLVGGNVRSGGDIAMMRYSKDRGTPSLQLLINHDDAAREFAYAEKDNYSLDSAAKYGFQVVSMKDDWKVVFAP